VKHQFLPSALTLLFLILAPGVFSQNLDLIVTGFSDYNRSAIPKKQYVFNAGSSIIASQKEIKPVKPVKNAVKTDLFFIVFVALVLKYERVISEDWSAQLGFFYSWDFPSYDEGFAANGFRITPELRYYLSEKKPAPGGAYLATNVRYQKLETENLEENSEATLVTYGIGINLGMQWILKNIFLIDVWVGPTYNIRNVQEQTVPGASIGWKSEDFFGIQGGVAIGLVF
jgi:hypothetical protein